MPDMPLAGTGDGALHICAVAHTVAASRVHQGHAVYTVYAAGTGSQNGLIV